MGARLLTAVIASALVLPLAAGIAWVRTGAGTSVEPELATYMGELQHHTHKLMLSVAAENAALAGFYLHEVHEIAEQVEALFPEHDGIPVAALVEQQLEPPLTALGEALAGPRWGEARAGLEALVAACNGCHAAADHGFIRVEITRQNPFNQSFAN